MDSLDPSSQPIPPRTEIQGMEEPVQDGEGELVEMLRSLDPDRRNIVMRLTSLLSALRSGHL